jgi:hypothetical protein
MRPKSNKLFKTLLDALYACPELFTEEQFKNELDKRDVVLIDFKAILKLCKDFVFEKHKGFYSIELTKVENYLKIMDNLINSEKEEIQR